MDAYYIGLLYIIPLLISSCFFMKRATVLWKPRYKKIYAVCGLGSIIITAVRIMSIQLNNEPLFYIISTVASIIIMIAFLYISVEEACLAAMFSNFILICMRGIVTGIFSVIMLRNTFQIITNHSMSLLLLSLSAIGQLVVIIICKNKMDIADIRVFLKSSKQKTAVLEIDMVLMVIMLFFCYNYYYNLNIAWFSFTLLIIPIIMLGLHFVILEYGINSAVLINREVTIKNIKESMKNKMLHHQALLKDKNTIDKFKHDYKELVLSAQYCYEQNQQSKLKKIIFEQAPTIIEQLPNTKSFSNNIGIDAALFEWAVECENRNIKFEATLFVPKETELKIVETIYQSVVYTKELLLSIIDKVVLEEEQINIQSKYKQNWLTISFSCAYKGEISMKDDTPLFYIQNKNNISIKSKYIKISEIVEGVMGRTFSIADNHKKIYNLTLSFYIKQEDNKK